MSDGASIRIGATEVLVLRDGTAPLPLDEELPGRKVDWAAERRNFPWAFDGEGAWVWPVQSFLVRSPAATVLVDAGIGHLGRPPYAVEGRIEDALRAVGASAVDVRHVVLTHLHGDHAGGVCRPDGSPRFPGATVHVHAADWAHFATDDHRGGFHARDAIAPLEAADALSVTTADADVVPGIRHVHTPGHTPGHRSVIVEDAGERVLLAGDLVHLPVQVAHPSWPSAHDGDPMLGVASRRLMLFRAGVGGWVVGVPHFVRPFGRVGTEGWVPEGPAEAGDRFRPGGPAR